MSISADFSIVPAFAAEGPGLRWRAFGAPGDLDLELESDPGADPGAPDRPALVTRVLAACALGGEEGSIWRLTLAARIGGLLAIRSATEGTAELPLRLRCLHHDCAEGLEVSLPVPALMDLARQAELEPVLRAEAGPGRRLHLRRPVGADQRAWGVRDFAGPAAARRAILGDLVVRGAVPEADTEIEALSERLAEFDPLTCFEVSVDCPACARPARIPVDLEAVLLDWLRAAQRALLLEVHRLARRYGWSEEQILAIPARRRRRYLRIEDEGGWW